MFFNGLSILSFGIVLLCGLWFGAVLTTYFYRLPRGIPISGTYKKPFCENCGYILRLADYFPVFNFFFTRGKCRGCGDKIDHNYFIIELSTAISIVLIYFKFGIGDKFISLSLASLSMILFYMVTFVDRKTISDPIYVLAISLFMYSRERNIFDIILPCFMPFFLMLVISRIAKKDLFLEALFISLFIGFFAPEFQLIISIFYVAIFSVLLCLRSIHLAGIFYPIWLIFIFLDY